MFSASFHLFSIVLLYLETTTHLPTQKGRLQPSQHAPRGSASIIYSTNRLLRFHYIAENMMRNIAEHKFRRPRSDGSGYQTAVCSFMKLNHKTEYTNTMQTQHTGRKTPVVVDFFLDSPYNCNSLLLHANKSVSGHLLLAGCSNDMPLLHYSLLVVITTLF